MRKFALATIALTALALTLNTLPTAEAATSTPIHANTSTLEFWHYYNTYSNRPTATQMGTFLLQTGLYARFKIEYYQERINGHNIYMYQLFVQSW